MPLLSCKGVSRVNPAAQHRLAADAAGAALNLAVFYACGLVPTRGAI